MRICAVVCWVLGAAILSPSDGFAQAGPARGLSTLPGGSLSVGYLNALRQATGTTAERIAALNYEAIDIVALAFALLQPDGSLDLTYSNFDLYQPHLVPQAHAHSRSVVMSVVGEFETVSASATLRQNLANHVLSALQTYGFDGVDFDWEWPNTATERTNFTAMLEAVHTRVKGASLDYIVMFVQGPGFWLAGTDWAAVRDYSDFCFCIAYDWKNPANGPIRKPGSVQFLGLNGGSIEAAAKGAIDYITGQGYPANRLIVGLPFYSSDNRSWFNGSPTWSADRSGFLNATHPDYLEVEFDGAWWTTPDCLKLKLNALMDPRLTALAGQQPVRGIGFWELGHEDLANPQLTHAIREWRSGDRSLAGLASPPPAETVTLIDSHAIWRYLDTTTFPGATWVLPGFNDSTWRQGVTPLGYGDGDEATVVNATNGRISTYARHAFNVLDPGSIRSLTMRLLRDDGAVVYLNGTEVWRSNMPEGIIAASTPAAGTVAGVEERSLYHLNSIDPALLNPGNNVLAVEIHQVNAQSSDISFDLQLVGQTVPARLTVVSPRARWKFLDSGVAPNASWADTGFNDQSWFEGRARLGYGFDGEWTPLRFGSDPVAKHITTYFRHTFTLAWPELLEDLRVTFQRDDGVILYLNGVEVARNNLPAGAVTPLTTALSAVGGLEETNWLTANLPEGLLDNGLNVLAAEIHQAGPTSSDIGFDAQLSAVLRPSLTIVRDGELVRLSWPAAAPGFRVWFADGLTSPIDWRPIEDQPNRNGTWLEVFLTVTSDARFYRLASE